MVKLEVKNGKIETKMVSDPQFPIYEELGNGIVELLLDFEKEAIRKGNPVEKVRAAMDEMLDLIVKNVKARGL